MSSLRSLDRGRLFVSAHAHSHFRLPVCLLFVYYFRLFVRFASVIKYTPPLRRRIIRTMWKFTFMRCSSSSQHFRQSQGYTVVVWVLPVTQLSLALRNGSWRGPQWRCFCYLFTTIVMSDNWLIEPLRILLWWNIWTLMRCLQVKTIKINNRFFFIIHCNCTVTSTPVSNTCTDRTAHNASSSLVSVPSSASVVSPLPDLEHGTFCHPSQHLQHSTF